jgi:hypothetical protein
MRDPDRFKCTDPASWLKCTDPENMINFLGEKATERKQRLLACACCRLPEVWKVLYDERSRAGIEVAERFADGQATREEFDIAAARSWDALEDGKETRTEAGSRVAAGVFGSWYGLLESAGDGVPNNDENAALDAIAAKEPVLLRDIFGNPFRPIHVDPSWRTPTVTALARAIYTNRSFDAMPILADALEEASCTSEEMLGHCRGEGEHVRGCWVVDLLLGKEWVATWTSGREKKPVKWKRTTVCDRFCYQRADRQEPFSWILKSLVK